VLVIGESSYNYYGYSYTYEFFIGAGSYMSSYGYAYYNADRLWYTYSSPYYSYTSEGTTFSQVGNYLYLDMDRTEADYTWSQTYPTYGCYSPEYASPIYTSAVGAYSGTSDSHCGYYAGTYPYEYDVWSVTPSSGQTVTVSVDTVADTTAFSPYMWILDEDECTLGWVSDSFDCSYAPSWGSCPSMEFVADAETYKIIIGSFGSCAGTTADYEILVDADSDPTLTLVADGVTNEWTGTAGPATTTFIDLDGEVIP